MRVRRRRSPTLTSPTRELAEPMLDHDVVVPNRSRASSTIAAARAPPSRRRRRTRCPSRAPVVHVAHRAEEQHASRRCRAAATRATSAAGSIGASTSATAHHPPATGGMSATSSPARSARSARAYASFTATSGVGGSRVAPAIARTRSTHVARPSSRSASSSVDRRRAEGVGVRGEEQDGDGHRLLIEALAGRATRTLDEQRPGASGRRGRRGEAVTPPTSPRRRPPARRSRCPRPSREAPSTA